MQCVSGVQQLPAVLSINLFLQGEFLGDHEKLEQDHRRELLSCGGGPSLQHEAPAHRHRRAGAGGRLHPHEVGWGWESGPGTLCLGVRHSVFESGKRCYGVSASLPFNEALPKFSKQNMPPTYCERLLLVGDALSTHVVLSLKLVFGVLHQVPVRQR